MENNLSNMINKLNTHCQQCLEVAVAAALSRNHASVELEHWLWALLNDKQFSEFINKHQTIEVDQWLKGINHALENVRSGSGSTPPLSNRIIEWIHEAWLIASLNQAKATISEIDLLLALVQNRSLSQICSSLYPDFVNITIDSINDLAANNELEDEQPQPQQQNQSALNNFAINLNELAKAGKIDPVIGREAEIYQAINVLGRRRQNNVILTGEPGVGKTAIVEGLALKIINKEVPSSLQNVVIYSLDIGLLQAGAGVKGEFEKRLKNLIAEIKKAPHPIILFIDEAHTLIGAGGQSGQNDAANLLKPALARGELRSIAATTWDEYVKYFEQDAALTRRFQVVKVEATDIETTENILRAMRQTLEKHHNILINESAIEAAAKLSDRYIQNRQLPDKAISILDTACARVASSQFTKPLEYTKACEQLHHVTQLSEQLLNEKSRGEQHKDKIKSLKAQIKQLNQSIATLEVDWQNEKDAVTSIITGLEKNTKNMKPLLTKLQKLQEARALVQPWVDKLSITQVITDWTGIPTEKMLNHHADTILNLEATLAKRIAGQHHALKVISQTMTNSQARLADPNKPLGVFLLVGPSGVGKTETALALAEAVYGSEKSIITINMSEFKEAHKVSLLLGSPPGYVGYGEGGILTEAVRRKPYSLVLLDEIEKAHGSVQEIFYQIFDKGTVKDGKGRDIDFKNTLILLTSNVASDTIISAAESVKGNSEKLQEIIHPELEQHFKPAFLGRMTSVPYYPLDKPLLNDILQLKCQRIANRLEQEHKVQLNIDKHLQQHIVATCTHTTLGARQIDNYINATILPELSKTILTQRTKKMSKLIVKLDDNQIICHAT